MICFPGTQVIRYKKLLPEQYVSVFFMRTMLIRQIQSMQVIWNLKIQTHVQGP
jgi:hypothetical protein